MRRLPLLTAALVTVGAPLAIAPPAFAADNVICVGSPSGTCDATAASISEALTAANANSVDDTILVGPGTYSDGPFELDGTAHALTLKGSGQDSTILTAPAAAASQSYVVANHADVENLTVHMQGAMSLADYAFRGYNGARFDHVTVDGLDATDAYGVRATGATVTSSIVRMPLDSSSIGIHSSGAGTEVTDTTITAKTGVSYSGDDPETIHLSRLTIRANGAGVRLDGGVIEIDDSLVDLGAGSGTGLLAVNDNGTGLKTITADHVTVVGGGAGSKGAMAMSSNPNAKQTSLVTLTNSIIRGPATSLVAKAGNDGAQGGNSIATVEVSHTDYETKSSKGGPNGEAEVVLGTGNVTLAPHFVNPASGNYHLAPGSPVVDRGDPATGGPAVDRSGAPRVVDGDGDGDPVRDMGAYELPDSIAPDTVITKHPPKRLGTKVARFTFSSEPMTTFRCRLDGGTWQDCASPWEQQVDVGRHRFAVRAKDSAGNVDATPARFTFRRVAG